MSVAKKKQSSKKQPPGKHSKPTTKAKLAKVVEKPQPPKDGLSVSALMSMFDQPDRQTVKKKLKGVEPAWVSVNLRLYRLVDRNREGRTVAELLSDASDPKLEEAKTRKIVASAQREELKFELEQGNYAPRSEFKQAAFELVSAMHKRLAKLYARQASPRLFKARTVIELQRMIETDISLVFTELKRDYPNMFEATAK